MLAKIPRGEQLYNTAVTHKINDGQTNADSSRVEIEQNKKESAVCHESAERAGGEKNKQKERGILQTINIERRSRRKSKG